MEQDRPLSDWLRKLEGEPRDALEAILLEPESPTPKVAAARMWLYAASGALSKSGVPIAGTYFTLIADRLEGKPASGPDVAIAVQINHVDTNELLTRIDEFLTSDNTRGRRFKAVAAESRPLLDGPASGSEGSEDPG